MLDSFKGSLICKRESGREAESEGHGDKERGKERGRERESVVYRELGKEQEGREGVKISNRAFPVMAGGLISVAVE